MRQLQIFAVLLVFAFFYTDCNEGGIETKACFTTQHHEEIIGDITVSVKFDATEFPGYDPSGDFDRQQVSDSQGNVCFKNIPFGTHWFVAIGYDEKIREQVIGQMLITFNFSTTQVDTILYVGEE